MKALDSGSEQKVSMPRKRRSSGAVSGGGSPGDGSLILPVVGNLRRTHCNRGWWHRMFVRHISSDWSGFRTFEAGRRESVEVAPAIQVTGRKRACRPSRRNRSRVHSWSRRTWRGTQKAEWRDNGGLLYIVAMDDNLVVCSHQVEIRRKYKNLEVGERWGWGAAIHKSRRQCR
jgi:hypothetical protein